MANDRNIVAGCASESTTVSRLLLNVRDDSSFGDRSKRQDIADRQGSVLSCIDELTGVHALIRNERLQSELESVGIAELNLCKRSSSAGVCTWSASNNNAQKGDSLLTMDNLLNHSADVS